MTRKILIVSTCIVLAVLVIGNVHAAGWVLEPSVRLDLGFDDNNGMAVDNQQEVGLSKVTAEVILRRNSKAHFFRGALLADAVTYYGDDDSIEPNSNQVAYFSTSLNKPRSRLGVNFNYRRDSLIREASVDDTSLGEEFGDENPDASVDQFLDIVRQRIFLNPFYRHNVSRRTDVVFNYRLSVVEHDRTTDDNDVFLNLEDFTNNEVSASLGFKITPLDRVKIRTVFKTFTTKKDNDEYDTYSLRFGYERSISATFKLGGEIGFRVTEFTEDGEESTEEGTVASLSAVKTTGLTKFELRGGVELNPSSIGEVVQTQEVIANVIRNISELTVFSFRGRAYENTVLSGSTRNNNDRRSIELRAEIRRNLSRSWSVSAAYRYRREKLESRPTFAEGNTFSFSVKYTKVSPLSL